MNLHEIGCTMFENHQKCRIWIFSKTRQNVPFWGIFNQNVNVARFACNFEGDFLYDFQTPWRIKKLTSNSEESNLVICCCKLASSPETLRTSFCILIAMGPEFPLSLLRLRFLLGVPALEEVSLSGAASEAVTNKWRLLATSPLLLAPSVPLLPPPSLASSPSDDQSSLLEILESSTNLKWL